MRSVIVGFGRISDTIRNDPKIAKKFRYCSHAQVLKDHPSFDWLGVVDPSEDARARAREWKVPYIGGLKEVAADVDPEFAVIATPPGTRLSILKAMPGLKHVMVEKPLGEEGRALLDYCRTRRIGVTVNFWRRGVECFQNFSNGEIWDSIGKIQAVNAIYGNGLYNNGSHLVDFIRMLFGDPIEARALGKVETIESLGCSGPLDDVSVAFDLEFDGFHCVAQPIDFNYYREVSVDIWGTTGRIIFGQESCSLFYHPVRKHRSMTDQQEISLDYWVGATPDFSRALWNLYDAIADGTSLSPGEEALKTQEILDRIAS